MKTKLITVTMLFIVATLTAFTDLVVACPNCKDALHDQTSMAFSISILLMMSMPFFIGAFWVTAIFKWRKSKKIQNRS